MREGDRVKLKKKGPTRVAPAYQSNEMMSNSYLLSRIATVKARWLRGERRGGARRTYVRPSADFGFIRRKLSAPSTTEVRSCPKRFGAGTGFEVMLNLF